MKKRMIFVSLFLIVGVGYSQIKKLKGYWNSQDDNISYIIYTLDKIIISSLYSDGDITFLHSKYGFYKGDRLPSIDSLKTEVDIKGKYSEYDYYEVQPEDFEKGVLAPYVNPGQVSFIDGGNTMIIYYSARQQYATYKRVTKLPEKLEAYLKEKGIKIEMPIIENKKK